MHAKGRDVLFDICGYVVKGCVRFGCARCPFSLTMYFIWYTSPLIPFLALAEKKGFIKCRNGYLS